MSGNRRAGDRRSADRQVPLAFDMPPSLAREDLIETASNQAAVALIDAWPTWPSPFAIIAGPGGSGKTHLCTAWAARADAHSMAKPSQPQGVDMEAAARGQPIACDGLELETIDEAALFHLLNAVRGAAGSILITAGSHPAHWPLRTADLKSRLASATATTIQPPDDNLLRAAALKMFADRQVSVDQQVIDYLIVRIERSLSAVADLVDRLDRAALARKGRITRQLAAEVLADMPPKRSALGL